MVACESNESDTKSIQILRVTLARAYTHTHTITRIHTSLPFLIDENSRVLIIRTRFVRAYFIVKIEYRKIRKYLQLELESVNLVNSDIKIHRYNSDSITD